MHVSVNSCLFCYILIFHTHDSFTIAYLCSDHIMLSEDFTNLVYFAFVLTSYDGININRSQDNYYYGSKSTAWCNIKKMITMHFAIEFPSYILSL